MTPWSAPKTHLEIWEHPFWCAVSFTPPFLFEAGNTVYSLYFQRYIDFLSELHYNRKQELLDKMVESTGGSMSKCKKRNATRTNIVSYPASSLVYEVTQKEYEAELERSSKLDNKVGIALAFFGVFSAYIIKFFDFSVLLNFETYPRSCLHIIKCITIFAQITIIFTYVITLILLFLTAKATKYMHFDCKYFIGDEQLYKSKSVSNVQTKVAMRYIGAIIKNTATNDTKAKNFNRAIFSLGVLILFCIVAEILRINFFNLGVG